MNNIHSTCISMFPCIYSLVFSHYNVIYVTFELFITYICRILYDEIEYKTKKEKDWGCASVLAGIQQWWCLMTDIRKLSLVLHCSSWNVPSSDTNKHKENILERDIQICNHRAAEILQFCIITICVVKRQDSKTD